MAISDRSEEQAAPGAPSEAHSALQPEQAPPVVQAENGAEPPGPNGHEDGRAGPAPARRAVRRALPTRAGWGAPPRGGGWRAGRGVPAPRGGVGWPGPAPPAVLGGEARAAPAAVLTEEAPALPPPILIEEVPAQAEDELALAPLKAWT